MEGGDGLLDFGVVPGAEVVADAGTEVVGFVVGAAGFGEGGFDFLDDLGDFCGALDAGYPAGAEFGGAADGGGACAADPEGERLLDGLGFDGAPRYWKCSPS